MTPQFDDLVGADLEPGERERLERVHRLLVEAGPPPELSPELELGPTLGTTLSRRRPSHRLHRRTALLAAAVVVLALAFLAGYVAGNGHGDGLAAGRTLHLVGTKAAPAALASLHIQPADAAGNWPMKLSVTGLPKLPPQGYYSVYLVRHGRPYAPCGTFVVAGADRGLSIWLNAPYRLEPGDTWVVTRQGPGRHEAGPVVLRPQRA